MIPSTSMHPVAPRRVTAALALAVALTACGARAGQSTTTTTTDGGAAGASLTFTCAQLCAPLGAAASCGSAGVSSCLAQCGASLAATPPACVGSANALYDCTRTATAQCAASTSFPFPSCASAYGAYGACVAAPPPVDAGGAPADVGATTDECAGAADCAACTARSTCGWCAGRCWTGSSTGPSNGSCGDSSWAWTSSQCAAPPRDAGAVPAQCQQCASVTCPDLAAACAADAACVACVASLSPSCVENARFRAFGECACGGGCADPRVCGSLCGGL